MLEQAPSADTGTLCIVGLTHFLDRDFGILTFGAISRRHLLATNVNAVLCSGKVAFSDTVKPHPTVSEAATGSFEGGLPPVHCINKTQELSTGDKRAAIQTSTNGQ